MTRMYRTACGLLFVAAFALCAGCSGTAQDTLLSGIESGVQSILTAAISALFQGVGSS